MIVFVMVSYNREPQLFTLGVSTTNFDHSLKSAQLHKLMELVPRSKTAECKQHPRMGLYIINEDIALAVHHEHNLSSSFVGLAFLVIVRSM